MLSQVPRSFHSKLALISAIFCNFSEIALSNETEGKLTYAFLSNLTIFFIHKSELNIVDNFLLITGRSWFVNFKI